MTSLEHQMSASYEPLAGMAPALAKTRLIGGYDTRTFSVAILLLIQDGFIAMETVAEGGTRLTRQAHAWPPQGAAARWLLKVLVGKSDFFLGQQNYVRLLTIRKGHAARLLREDNRLAGNGGALIMAGVGLVVLMSIGMPL